MHSVTNDRDNLTALTTRRHHFATHLHSFHSGFRGAPDVSANAQSNFAGEFTVLGCASCTCIGGFHSTSLPKSSFSSHSCLQFWPKCDLQLRSRRLSQVQRVPVSHRLHLSAIHLIFWIGVLGTRGTVSRTSFLMPKCPHLPRELSAYYYQFPVVLDCALSCSYTTKRWKYWSAMRSDCLIVHE